MIGPRASLAITCYLMVFFQVAQTKAADDLDIEAIEPAPVVEEKPVKKKTKPRSFGGSLNTLLHTPPKGQSLLEINYETIRAQQEVKVFSSFFGFGGYQSLQKVQSSARGAMVSYSYGVTDEIALGAGVPHLLGLETESTNGPASSTPNATSKTSRSGRGDPIVRFMWTTSKRTNQPHDHFHINLEYSPKSQEATYPTAGQEGNAGNGGSSWKAQLQWAEINNSVSYGFLLGYLLPGSRSLNSSAGKITIEGGSQWDLSFLLQWDLTSRFAMKFSLQHSQKSAESTSVGALTEEMDAYSRQTLELTAKFLVLRTLQFYASYGQRGQAAPSSMVGGTGLKYTLGGDTSSSAGIIWSF